MEIEYGIPSSYNLQLILLILGLGLGRTMVGGTRWKWIGHGWAPVSIPGTVHFKSRIVWTKAVYYTSTHSFIIKFSIC